MRRGLWLVLVLGVAGCGAKQPPPPMIETQAAEVGGRGQGEEPPPSPQTPVTKLPPGADVGGPPTPLEVGPGTIDSAPKVTLEEPGKEPRRVARHTFKAGARQAYSMSSTARVSGVPVPIPAIRVDAPIEIRVKAVKDGDAEFSYVAGPFKTGQASGGGALGGILGAVGGGGLPERIVARGWVSPQGLVRDFTVEEGGQDDSAPVEVGEGLPAEPIGIGARWTTEVTVEEKDGPVRQTSRYELLSFQGSTLQLRVERDHVPVSGGKDAPGSGTSKGEITVRLGEFYATGRTTIDKAMRLSLPGLDGAGLRLRSDVTVKKR